MKIVFRRMTMSAVLPMAVTVDELAAMPDAERFELIDGTLVEREMSPECAYVALKIGRKLDEFFDSRPIGYVFSETAGYTLRPEETEQLRLPDVSVVLKSKIPDGRLPKTRFDFAPDLAVEVLSPSDLVYNVEDKIQDYLKSGTRLVWQVNPSARRVIVYRPDGTQSIFGPNDELTGETLLPGFRLKVGDIFPA
jgi:Uma2 family endonuclease